MSNIQFGSPTFLYRDECTTNLYGVLSNIAQCGFDGLELYGLFGHCPKLIREMCDDLGIIVMGDHIPYDEFVGETGRVIQDHVILGTKFITIDRIPEDKLPGKEGFFNTITQIEKIGKLCKEAGMQLLYHNHGYDMIDTYKGERLLDLLLDAVDPEFMSFQPDLGWIALGGGNPEYYLEKYRDRCPVIHLKDYYADEPVLLRSPSEVGKERGGERFKNFEFRPTGYGIMNFPRLMKKVFACSPEWLVADHDLSYERDSIVDLGDSLAYVRKLVHISDIPSVK